MTSIEESDWLDGTGTVGAGGHRRRRLVLALVGVVALVIAAVVVVRTRSQSPGLRTATVARHTVTADLAGVGTIQSVSQASVAFPISGTVESVDVAPGDAVSAGQPLASLDDTDLQRALHTAQADAAQATLDLDGDGTGTSTPGASDPSSSTTTSVSASQITSAATDGTTAARSRTTSTALGASGLDAARSRLLAAQQRADDRLNAAEAALDAARDDCATAPSDSTTATAGAAASATLDTQGCQAALEVALRAQQSVAAAQRAVDAAASAYDRLSRSQTTPTDSSSGSGTSGPTTLAPSSPTDSDATSDRGRAGSDADADRGTDTAATSAASLIAKQQTVDAAQAAVEAATQALGRATIVSPISGTVLAVGLATGDTVAAASTTAHIIISGRGGDEVTMMVPVEALPKVKAGQTASVTPDGSATTRHGKVVAIGLSASTSDGKTVYPVSVSLTGATGPLRNGATVSVDIATQRASNVVAVPTSAVTTVGTRHVVRTLDGHATREVTVGVGAVGATWTQITSGLDPGTRIVLADLGTPLPGSVTQTRSTASLPGRIGGEFSPRGANGGGPSGFSPRG